MSSPLLQPAALLVMFYGGILAGGAYDLCRLVRRICNNRAVNVICDGIFVLLFGALAAFSLLWATGGAFRPYAALGFIIGFGAEQVSISKIFFSIYHKISETVYKLSFSRQENK